MTELTQETPQTPTEPTSSETPTANSDWLNSLPEQFRADPAINRFASAADPMAALLASQVGLNKHFGIPADQLLRLPKEDDAEGWKGVLDRLPGDYKPPAKPEDYAFNGIDLTNETDKAFVEGFRSTAHDLGFSQKQMDGVLGYLNTALSSTDAAYTKAVEDQRAAANAELDKAWGDKAATYRKEIPGLVEKLATKAGFEDPKAIYAALNESGATDNPAFMRMLAVMADMTAEGGSLPGVGSASEAGDPASVEQAKADLASLVKSPEYLAMQDPKTPNADRQATKEKYMNLVRLSSQQVT